MRFGRSCKKPESHVAFSPLDDKTIDSINLDSQWTNYSLSCSATTMPALDASAETKTNRENIETTMPASLVTVALFTASQESHTRHLLDQNRRADW